MLPSPWVNEAFLKRFQNIKIYVVFCNMALKYCIVVLSHPALIQTAPSELFKVSGCWLYFILTAQR